MTSSPTFRGSVLVLLAVTTGCVCGSTGESGAAPPGASGYRPMAATGPTTWTIEGVAYEIVSTYYLVLARDEVTYTIEVRVPSEQIPADGFDDESARAFARPLMMHAVRTDEHLRHVVHSLSGGALPVKWIGVVLLTRVVGDRANGFRTRADLAQVTQWVQEEPSRLR